MSTSVRRRLCARAATGRWLKKVGSATERECSRHMEAAELETSVLCCFASLTMSLASVFGLCGLSQLFQEACVPCHSHLSLDYVASAKHRGKRVKCRGH